MKIVTLLSFLIIQGHSFSVNVLKQKNVVPSSFTLSESIVDVVEAKAIEVNPKEAVKLFGRLAEKYIMLDSSGGMCCYSACSDCEYRLPDGGYRMADQSASRPKWIPVYEHLKFEASGKEHVSKWSTEIFVDSPVVTKEEFVNALTSITYAPPLGGPYVGASASSIEDNTLSERLFDVLVGDNNKDKLTRHRMHLSLKTLANGENGMTWPTFLKALE